MADQVEKRINSVRKCPLFKDLGAELHRLIAEKSEEVTVETGYLFHQGEDTRHFYLVVSGRIELSCGEIITGQDTSVVTAGPTSLVGYNAHLLSPEYGRQSRSARVDRKSVLLKISDEVLVQILEKKPLVYNAQRVQAINEELSMAPQNEVIKLLREDLHALKKATVSVFSNRERVFEEGEPSRHVYFVLSGSVKIVKKSVGGSENMIARLRPGQYFGEVGVENDGYRFASVDSEGISSLLRIDRADFREMLDRNKDLRHQIKNQQNLYSSADSANPFIRVFKNMKIPARVSAFTLGSMAFVVTAWYTMGVSQLEENLSKKVVYDNQIMLTGAKRELDEYADNIDKVAYFFERSAVDASGKGEEVGYRAHRELDVYFLPPSGGPMSIPEHVEKSIMSTINKIASGEKGLGGYHLSKGEDGAAFYRVNPVFGADESFLGMVVSVFDPSDIIRDNQVIFSFAGAKPSLGEFPGRAKDLDRIPMNFLQIGPNMYTISRVDQTLGDQDLTVYSWKDVTAAVAREEELKTAVLVVLLSGALFAVVASHFITMIALFPLKDLSHSLRRLTEGQRSIPIPYADRKNEIGELAASISHLQDNMQQHEAIVADRMVEQQRKVQEQEGNKILIKKFEAQFEDYIGDFTEAVKSLAAVSEQLRDGSASASANTDDIYKAFQETKKKVEKVNALSDNLKIATKLIEQRTSASKQSLNEAIDSSTTAKASISELNTSVEGIGSILDLINDLAEKTRLLALNATIEAAKAGPSGRGFGVVAQEVRNLAIQTFQATSRIKPKISDIESASDGAVKSLLFVIDIIERMTGEQDDILKAVAEQSKATRNIALDAALTKEQANQVSESMDGISMLVSASKDGSQELSDSAIELKERTDVFKRDITGFIKSIS